MSVREKHQKTPPLPQNKLKFVSSEKKLQRIEMESEILKKLKECRSIATRSEKIARNYLAMVKLGTIRLFIRRLLG